MTASFIDIAIIDIQLSDADKDHETGRWRIPMVLNRVPPARWIRLFASISACEEPSTSNCLHLRLAADTLFVWCAVEKANSARLQVAEFIAEANKRYKTGKEERAQLRAIRAAMYHFSEGQHPRSALHLSGEHRAVLGDVSDQVDKLLGTAEDIQHTSDKGTGLAATLQKAARHFGSDYPDIARAVDKLLDTLNSMGI